MLQYATFFTIQTWPTRNSAHRQPHSWLRNRSYPYTGVQWPRRGTTVVDITWTLCTGVVCTMTFSTECPTSEKTSWLGRTTQLVHSFCSILQMNTVGHLTGRLRRSAERRTGLPRVARETRTANHRELISYTGVEPRPLITASILIMTSPSTDVFAVN